MIKNLITLLTATLFFNVLAFATSPSVSMGKIAKYGKVLAGTGESATITVELAEVGTSGEFLIRVNGVNNDIDGKAIRYTREPAGSDAFFFVHEEKNRLREQKSYGGKMKYELYLDGKTHKLSIDEKLTKDFKTESLQSAKGN